MNSKFKPRPAKIKPLAAYLSDQEETLKSLKRSLEAERSALKVRNMEGLTEASKLKSSLMVKLQNNDQRIKLHPDAPKLKTEFAKQVVEIKDALADCRLMNESNGKLIHLCINSTRRVTSLLMAIRDSFTMNMTYTDKGCTTATGPERVNVRA